MKTLIALLSLTLSTACYMGPEDDMARASIFRDKNARTTLQPLGGALTSIDVHNKSEFIAALTSLPPLGGTGDCYGKAIYIANSFKFNAQVVLGPQHNGLTISSTASAVIDANFNGQPTVPFMIVGATDVTIDGLVLGPNFVQQIAFAGNATNLTGANLTVKNTVIDPGSALTKLVQLNNGVGFGLYVMNNRVRTLSTDVMLVEGQGGESQVSVFSGNVNFGGGIVIDEFLLSSVAANQNLGSITVAVNAVRLTINGNGFDNIGHTVALLFDGFGGCAITGNALRSAPIDTSLTSGLNTIVGNTEAGAIASAGSDAVGLNT